jgi:protein-disulfide isomerase
MTFTSIGRLRSVLDLISTVLVIVAASAVIGLTVRNWRQGPAQTSRPPLATPPKAAQPIDGAESIGSTSAPLAMVIYSDFQCPYCAKFARETWPSIKKDFIDTGRLLVIFRHLPLPMHNEAKGAALAANCAGRQGKFWQFHDLLFKNQQQLSLQAEHELASDAGMNLRRFDECIQQQPGSADIARDMESARSLGLNTTPTFLIGRIQPDRKVKVLEVVVGAQPENRFEVAFANAAAIKPASE